MRAALPIGQSRPARRGRAIISCMTESGSEGLMRHFTMHDGNCDVPALLERVRAAIVERGAIDVFDITFKAHWDGPNYVAEMTVYFWPSDDAHPE
jgi:hypothetical protein